MNETLIERNCGAMRRFEIMKPASEKRTRAWSETRFSNFQLASSGSGFSLRERSCEPCRSEFVPTAQTRFRGTVNRKMGKLQVNRMLQKGRRDGIISDRNEDEIEDQNTEYKQSWREEQGEK